CRRPACPASSSTSRPTTPRRCGCTRTGASRCRVGTCRCAPRRGADPVRVAPGNPPPVLAAGVLVWRERGGAVQVLLVPRPRYDDWSIPKGKLDKGETFPAAAVREVAEETGYRVRLHRPLPAS